MREISAYYIDSAAALAAASGHIELLELLHDKCSRNCYGQALAGAAGSGQSALAQWIMENMRARVYSDDSRLYMENAAVIAAAEYGHLELAAWIHAHRAYPERANYRLEAVAAGGNLASVQWTAAHTSELHGATSAVRVAIEGGYLDILEWLYERNGPESAQVGWHAMDVAAEHGHLHILQWLHDHGSTRCTSKAIELAAANGHIEVVEWLLAHRTSDSVSEAMAKAVVNGHFEILLLLHAHGSDDGSWVPKALSDAFRRDEMDIVLWLFEQYPDVLTPDTIEAFVGSDAKYVAQLQRGELVWLCMHASCNTCACEVPPYTCR